MSDREPLIEQDAVVWVIGPTMHCKELEDLNNLRPGSIVCVNPESVIRTIQQGREWYEPIEDEE